MDATRNGAWFMPSARSEEAHSIQISLTAIAPPAASRGHDLYLWRRASSTFSNAFSLKETWEQLRIRSPLVTWSKV